VTANARAELQRPKVRKIGQVPGWIGVVEPLDAAVAPRKHFVPVPTKSSVIRFCSASSGRTRFGQRYRSSFGTVVSMLPLADSGDNREARFSMSMKRCSRGIGGGMIAPTDY
jgi:hypothetical protein